MFCPNPAPDRALRAVTTRWTPFRGVDPTSITDFDLSEEGGGMIVTRPSETGCLGGEKASGHQGGRGIDEMDRMSPLYRLDDRPANP